MKLRNCTNCPYLLLSRPQRSQFNQKFKATGLIKKIHYSFSISHAETDDEGQEKGLSAPVSQWFISLFWSYGILMWAKKENPKNARNMQNEWKDNIFLVLQKMISWNNMASKMLINGKIGKKNNNGKIWQNLRISNFNYGFYHKIHFLWQVFSEFCQLAEKIYKLFSGKIR